MKLNFYILVLILIFFCGCSTYSKKDCMDMNVALEAEKMAQNGMSESDVVNYFDKECRIENNVAMDANQIALGHKNGLKQLCTPEGMTRLGQVGIKYNDTCPALKPDSLKEYYKNYTFNLEKEVEKLKDQVSDLERENSRLKSEISDLQSKLNN